jgi:DNA helicase-2/ATP-dependent DNA helicase PcrA
MLELNPEQRRAVEHGEGPLLVIAGPGSGKTRVITERIVHLLRSVSGLQPENILAVTFTDKAAAEMKERVRRALGDPPALPHISTFHAFCYEVLRKRHFERRLLDKVDVWIFLRQRMEHLGLDFYRKLAEPGAFLHDLNEFFSRCQDELIEPEDFGAFVAQVEKAAHGAGDATTLGDRSWEEDDLQKLQELSRVFRTSRQLMEDAGCSSLGSLISETVRLFDREPETAAHYRARFRYVLLDEFQDTNFAQVELLRRLVAPPHHITAVGDDDQAIYRFRGAAHGAFEMFHRAFPGGQVVNLHRNYRSTQRILRVADAVIAKNHRAERKRPLVTEREEGARIFLVESPDYRSEAAWVAGEVERLAREGTPLAGIALLYRAHSYRAPLVREFRRRQIPFAIRGLSILSTIILRDLRAYLNLIHSPHDNISLTRILLAPRWKFPEELARDVRRQATRERCSVYDVLQARERMLLREEIESTGWPELKRLLSELRRDAGRLPVSALLDLLVERLELKFHPGETEGLYVNAFRKFLQAWEEKSETRRLPEFMEYFQYFEDAGGKIEIPEPPDSTPAVQMMTAHAAKGLEFPVVFVVSVAPRRFPHAEQKPVIQFPAELRKGPVPPADIHQQEERRLFFVALTRAQDRLYISGIGKPGKKSSAFLEDLRTDASLRARDLEVIHAPELPEEAAEAASPPPVPSWAHPSGEATQPGLFNEPRTSGASLCPDLTAWASRPPEPASDGKLWLSATAIESFLECPLKFKFAHYLKVPTGPQPALTFGSVMHQCVRHYFQLRRKAMPSFEQMQEFYLRAWRDAGFEDAYQEQAYKTAGSEQLRQFVARQNQTALDAEGVRTEQSFMVELGDVVLEGRIDQINPLGSRHDREVELVDYKTGRPRSQKDADKSLQLSIYALAARRQWNLHPARLTFYNLTNNEPVSTVRTGKDLERVVQDIGAVAAEIRQLRLAPNPGFACKFCDYVPICPAHEEIG